MAPQAEFGIALCPQGPYDLAGCSACRHPPCCCSGVSVMCT